MRNKLRARVIPAIAAGLGGVAMLGVSALPASAAPTAAAAPARASAPMWFYYKTYGTLSLCRYAGINKDISGGFDWQCREVTDGAFFVWALWLQG